MCRTEQLQVSSRRTVFAAKHSFPARDHNIGCLQAGHIPNNKGRKRLACPVFYLKLPLLGRWQGGTKGETGIPWLMEVKALWKKKPSPFPILLPSQSSTDYHFSPFLPLWHTQQVRFTLNTH